MWDTFALDFLEVTFTGIHYADVPKLASLRRVTSFLCLSLDARLPHESIERCETGGEERPMFKGNRIK